MTNKLTNGDIHEDRPDKLPEWMDYNPSTERKSVRQLESIPPAPPPGFSNDLEAWKSDMKLRDKNIEESELSPSQPSTFHGKGTVYIKEGWISIVIIVLLRTMCFVYIIDEQQQPPQQQPKKEVSDLDLLLGSMGSMELQKPQPSNVDFLSPSILESSSPSLSGRRERGSRFAKFFAKREEAGLPIPHEQQQQQQQQPVQQQQSIPAQGKSISVNDLFGGNLPQASPQQQQPQPIVAERYPQPEPSGAPRMLSEEEVLQSLGAKRSPQQQQVKPSAEGALGFDKVLQILSQPKV